MTEDDGGDRAAELAVFRAVQEYVREARAAGEDVVSAARRLGEVMSLGAAEIVAAVRDMGTAGPAHITSSGGLALASLAFGGEVVVSVGPEAAAVAQPQDVGELSARVSRNGIAGLSAKQVFAVVLLWVVVLGVILAQQVLPPDDLARLANDIGIITLGYFVTKGVLGRED